MSKLAITPVLVTIEWVFYSKPASPRVLASVAVLMVGITMCTITDTQVGGERRRPYVCRLPDVVDGLRGRLALRGTGEHAYAAFPLQGTAGAFHTLPICCDTVGCMQVASNPAGMAVAVAAVLVTSLYQVCATRDLAHAS